MQFMIYLSYISTPLIFRRALKTRKLKNSLYRRACVAFRGILNKHLYICSVNTVNCHYGGHLLGNNSSCSRPNGVKPRLYHKGLNCWVEAFQLTRTQLTQKWFWFPPSWKSVRPVWPRADLLVLDWMKVICIRAASFICDIVIHLLTVLNCIHVSWI